MRPQHTETEMSNQFQTKEESNQIKPKRRRNRRHYGGGGESSSDDCEEEYHYSNRDGLSRGKNHKIFETSSAFIKHDSIKMFYIKPKAYDEKESKAQFEVPITLNGQRYLQLVLVDESSCSSRIFTLDESPVQKKDLRYKK